MREQIRLWFYSQWLHVGDARRPLAVRSVLDLREGVRRNGQPMHKSTGNSIESTTRSTAWAPTSTRWLYCGQPPNQPRCASDTGSARRGEAALAHLLELRLVLRHLCVRSRRFDSGRPRSRAPGSRSTAGSRRGTAQLVARCDRRVRAVLDAGHRSLRSSSYVEDLSNWYIRRSRRRFWDERHCGARALYDSLDAGAARDRAGHAVPRRSPLAAPPSLISRTSRCTSRSWPDPCEVDDALPRSRSLDVRRVVELGRRARDEGAV